AAFNLLRGGRVAGIALLDQHGADALLKESDLLRGRGRLGGPGPARRQQGAGPQAGEAQGENPGSPESNLLRFRERGQCVPAERGGALNQSTGRPARIRRRTSGKERVNGTRLLVFVLALTTLALSEDADFGDLLAVVVSNDGGADALFRIDLGEHLVLQAVFNLVTGLNLLGLLVELPLDHLDLVGDREGLLVSLLKLLGFLVEFGLGEGDFAVADLGNGGGELLGEGDADTESQYEQGTDNLAKHGIAPSH